MCASGSEPPSCCCVQTLGLPAGNGIFKRGRPEPERQNAPYLLADSSHARSRSRSAPPRRHVASQPGRAPRSSAGPAPASRFPASYTALAITGGRGRGEAWVRYLARARARRLPCLRVRARSESAAGISARARSRPAGTGSTCPRGGARNMHASTPHPRIFARGRTMTMSR
jgi:hypothetical protein